MKLDRKLKIGVLVGGSKTEQGWSIKSGRNIIKDLKNNHFENVRLIKIGPGLINHVKDCDLIFISTFGKPWQSGLVQSLCEKYGVPYTGSDPRASSLAFNKHLAKRIFKMSGIPTPPWFYSRGKAINWDKIINKIGKDIILKPVNEGLSKGVTRVKDQDSYLKNFRKINQSNVNVVIERYIEGAEITVPVIRAKNTVVLQPIEITKLSDTVNYLKIINSGKMPYKVFSAEFTLINKIKKTASKCFAKLNCRGIGYVDMIIENGTFKTYVLEVGTIPGYTDKSKVPFSARVSKIPLRKLLEISMLIALNKNIDLKKYFKDAK